MHAERKHERLSVDHVEEGRLRETQLNPSPWSPFRCDGARRLLRWQQRRQRQRRIIVELWKSERTELHEFRPGAGSQLPIHPLPTLMRSRQFAGRAVHCQRLQHRQREQQSGVLQRDVRRSHDLGNWTAVHASDWDLARGLRSVRRTSDDRSVHSGGKRPDQCARRTGCHVISEPGGALVDERVARRQCARGSQVWLPIRSSRQSDRPGELQVPVHHVRLGYRAG